MDTQTKLKCIDLVANHCNQRLNDLRKLWAAFQVGDDGVDDLGNLYDYGLDFGYVTPWTFGDQPNGYFRYQISCGGPSDEFRIYADKITDYQFNVTKIEYWYMDWFDGARKLLTGSKLRFMKELFESFFVESGSANTVYVAATQVDNL